MERCLACEAVEAQSVCEEFGLTKVPRITQAEIEDWLAESEWAPPRCSRTVDEISCFGVKLRRCVLTQRFPHSLRRKAGDSEQKLQTIAQ